jgi:hypothetical protein
MRLSYERTALEHRELAAPVRAARGNKSQAADFEQCAAVLEQLARPKARTEAA